MHSPAVSSTISTQNYRKKPDRSLRPCRNGQSIRCNVFDGENGNGVTTVNRTTNRPYTSSVENFYFSATLFVDMSSDRFPIKYEFPVLFTVVVTVVGVSMRVCRQEITAPDVFYARRSITVFQSIHFSRIPGRLCVTRPRTRSLLVCEIR